MTPKPPRHLKRPGREFWAALVTEYEIHDAGGRALVTTAAECLDRQRAAQAAIAQDGAVVHDRYGRPKAHPACQLERDSRNGFLAALKVLNLDIQPPRPRPGNPGGPRSLAQRMGLPR